MARAFSARMFGARLFLATAINGDDAVETNILAGWPYLNLFGAPDDDEDMQLVKVKQKYAKQTAKQNRKPKPAMARILEAIGEKPDQPDEESESDVGSFGRDAFS